jgi:shikimate dehydrogenase
VDIDVEECAVMRHIILIGLPGGGKTSLGQMAAERLGVPFLDLDALIEEREQMPIRRIFELLGEAAFREIESRILREALESPAPSIIASGGGVVLKEDNVQVLCERGFVLFLDRPVEDIEKDVLWNADRPLLTSPEKLRRLDRERRPLYEAAANATVRNDGSLEEALEKLLRFVPGVPPDVPERGFAVIGDPIAHSLSPAIHGAVFSALGIEAPYVALRVPKENLAGFTERARVSGLRGFNVTLPLKREIIPLLDEVEEEARLCGAVNTVTVGEDWRLSGFNTDMEGLLASLRDNGYDYRDCNVLILGAGGAARGVAFKAAREGAEKITILARRLDQAEELVSAVKTSPIIAQGGRAHLSASRSLLRKTYDPLAPPDRRFCAVGSPTSFRTVNQRFLKSSSSSVHAGDMSPETLSKAASDADILVNATPLGMEGFGKDFPSLAFLRRLPKGALVCDLVYKPPHTRLLREAENLGHAAQNGLGMLIHQALLADELFLGRPLDKPALYKIVYGKLGGR